MSIHLRLTRSQADSTPNETTKMNEMFLSSLESNHVLRNSVAERGKIASCASYELWRLCYAFAVILVGVLLRFVRVSRSYGHFLVHTVVSLAGPCIEWLPIPASSSSSSASFYNTIRYEDRLLTSSDELRASRHTKFA